MTLRKFAKLYMGMAKLRDALNAVANIPDGQHKNDALRFINLATGDTGASARMCHILFNQLLTFQQAQFETREIIHPEQDSLPLCKAELAIVQKIEKLSNFRNW